MEIVEQIRLEYEQGVGTIKGVARKFGVDRRLVRKAITSAIFEKKKPMRDKPKLGPAVEFIDSILRADQKLPRKERHTAHRIWLSLRKEMPAPDIGESTVRKYVRER